MLLSTPPGEPRGGACGLGTCTLLSLAQSCSSLPLTSLQREGERGEGAGVLVMWFLQDGPLLLPSLLHCPLHTSPSFLLPAPQFLFPSGLHQRHHFPKCPLCHLRDRIQKPKVMSIRKPLIPALPCVRQCWDTEGNQIRSLPSKDSGKVA